MEHLIPIVNKLQDVFGAIGQQEIDLPQIVVVGSQSAGKSSVLENIVGRDFLPRGNGIMTRRPLILQLYSLADSESNDNTEDVEWGEFLHLPEQKFYEFSKIRDEIVRETDRATGSNKGISSASINLKIFSPHVLNLTLVDLPGITKVPTGDQPADVEERILNMCNEFVCKPNAIILAVSSANQDLANSEGLKLARTVDPEGNRTIGVITKIDIMDAGTDALDILNNRVIPLKRGYIGVINRSQKDINDGVSIREGLKKEQNFFRKDPVYRSVSTQCGTLHLSRTLNHILMQHIRECLPDIKTRIVSLLEETQTSLNDLGEGIDLHGQSDTGERSRTLLHLLSTFTTNISNNTDGRGISTEYMDLPELKGGARVYYIFNQIFGRKLRGINAFEGLEDEDIRIAIANANGNRPALFVPEIAFDLLVKRQIRRLEQPGLQCADMVLGEMQRIAYQSEVPEMTRFPDLRDKVFEVVSRVLKTCMTPTQQMISNLINVELAYINTAHPDFIGGNKVLGSLHRRPNQQPPPGTNQTTNIEPSFDPNRPIGSTHENQSLPPSPSSTPLPPPPSPSPSTQPVHPSTMSVPQPVTEPPVTTPSRGFLQVYKGGGGGGTGSGGGGGGGGGSQSLAGDAVGKGRAHDPNRWKLNQVPDRMRMGPLVSERDRVEMEVIKSLIASYYEIVKKNYIDLVPKTIMLFLVNAFKNSIQTELVTELYRDGTAKNLLRESAEVAEHRKELRETKELLQRALEIVNEVRDFNIYNK